MTVQRVDRGTLRDQVLHVDGMAPSDCILPCRIHVCWFDGALNKKMRFRPTTSITVEVAGPLSAGIRGVTPLASARPAGRVHPRQQARPAGMSAIPC